VRGSPGMGTPPEPALARCGPSPTLHLPSLPSPVWRRWPWEARAPHLLRAEQAPQRGGTMSPPMWVMPGLAYGVSPQQRWDASLGICHFTQGTLWPEAIPQHENSLVGFLDTEKVTEGLRTRAATLRRRTWHVVPLCQEPRLPFPLYWGWGCSTWALHAPRTLLGSAMLSCARGCNDFCEQ